MTKFYIKTSTLLKDGVLHMSSSYASIQRECEEMANSDRLKRHSG